MGNTPESCRHLTSPNNETAFKLLYECWIERSTASQLQKCLPLTILSVSLICNCLSFVALRNRHMRGTSTAFFMLALSVLDPLVLLTKNLVYFPTFITEHSASCKLLYFLIYVYGYTNVWILVIMTADKFFAVWFPLKVSYFCTITRAKYVCIFLLTVTSVISFHHFWTIDSIRVSPDVDQRHCSYDSRHYPIFSRNWRYVDFVIWCFLPFILIFTLSVLIIYKLRQKRQDPHRNIRQIINTNLNNERGKENIKKSFFFFREHPSKKKS